MRPSGRRGDGLPPKLESNPFREKISSRSRTGDELRDCAD
jgi:hypothetical protein